MDKDIIVQIADMKMARGSGKLITYALGSCVGISLYDPRIKLGALIHIMLPAMSGFGDMQIFKYADSAIANTLRKLQIMGASKASLVCKIAGGAKMFESFSDSALGNIGARNVEAVKIIMNRERIPIRKQEVHGNVARTMVLDIETGNVYIRTIGKPEILL